MSWPPPQNASLDPPVTACQIIRTNTYRPQLTISGIQLWVNSTALPNHDREVGICFLQWHIVAFNKFPGNKEMHRLCINARKEAMKTSHMLLYTTTHYAVCSLYRASRATRQLFASSPLPLQSLASYDTSIALQSRTFISSCQTCSKLPEYV